MTPVALPDWCRLVRADNPGPMTLQGTNTWVLSTAAGAVVVDPGPLLEEHLAAVAALGPVALAVVTHHHADHCGGLDLFRSLTGAPVLGRDPARSGADDALPADGAELGVPGSGVPGSGVPGSGVPGLRIRVLDTPGHTADSVSFLVSDGRSVLLLTGDTVLGAGTTVVSHPDGDLAAYLASLERLRSAVPAATPLLPGHGPVRDAAAPVLDEYLTHRRARLDEVRAALASGARTAREVVEIVYAGVDQSLWPAAERTVEASLHYLRPGRK